MQTKVDLKKELHRYKEQVGACQWYSNQKGAQLVRNMNTPHIVNSLTYCIYQNKVNVYKPSSQYNYEEWIAIFSAELLLRDKQHRVVHDCNILQTLDKIFGHGVKQLEIVELKSQTKVVAEESKVENAKFFIVKKHKKDNTKEFAQLSVDGVTFVDNVVEASKLEKDDANVLHKVLSNLSNDDYNFVVQKTGFVIVDEKGEYLTLYPEINTLMFDNNKANGTLFNNETEAENVGGMLKTLFGKSDYSVVAV